MVGASGWQVRWHAMPERAPERTGWGCCCAGVRCRGEGGRGRGLRLEAWAPGHRFLQRDEPRLSTRVLRYLNYPVQGKPPVGRSLVPLSDATLRRHS